MHRTNPPVQLPSAAADLLNALWARAATFDGDGPRRDAHRGELRDVARALSAAAHDAALLPEHLIVAIKESWAAHDGRRTSADHPRAPWLVTELVSLCIREFYGDAAGAHPARDVPSR